MEWIGLIVLLVIGGSFSLITLGFIVLVFVFIVSWLIRYIYLVKQGKLRTKQKQDKLRENAQRINVEIESRLNAIKQFLDSSDWILQRAAMILCYYSWRNPELHLQAFKEFDKLLMATSAKFSKQRKLVFREFKHLFVIDFGYAIGILDINGKILCCGDIGFLKHDYISLLLPSPVEDLLPQSGGANSSIIMPITEVVSPGNIGTFPITVDYNISFERMLTEINCNEYIIKENLKGHIIEGEDPSDQQGTVESQTYIFNFGCEMKTGEVLNKMYTQGFRPATVAELVAFGIQYPQKRTGLLIVALGTVWFFYFADSYGHAIRQVASTSWSSNNKSNFYLQEVDLDKDSQEIWSSHICFLAVQEVPNQKLKTKSQRADIFNVDFSQLFNSLFVGEPISTELWLEVRKSLKVYPWYNKQFKKKALRYLGFAKEMAEVDEKRTVINYIKEIFNYLLLDRLLANGIKAEELWWREEDCYEMELDNSGVSLSMEVYDVISQLNNAGLNLQTKVLHYSSGSTKPVFVVSLFGRKWFKIYEWI